MDFDLWYRTKLSEHRQTLKSCRNKVHVVRPNMNKRMTKKIRKRVTLQENDSVNILKIRDFSAMRQPGSGCIKGLKGDSVSCLDMCECKQTEKDFISIKMEWLIKIIQECCGLFPLLHIRFIGGFQKEDIDWWMCPERFFDNIYIDPSLCIETNYKSKVFYKDQFDEDINAIKIIWRLMAEDNTWFILPQYYFVDLIGSNNG